MIKFHAIRNAKIRTKLLGCLIILASMTAVIGYVANQNTTAINNQFTAIVNNNTPRLTALLQLQDSAAKVETSVTELGADTDSLTQQTGQNNTAKEELLAGLESLQNAQTEYARQAKTTPDKVKDITSVTDHVSNSAALLVSALEQNASRTQLALLYDSLHSAVDELGAKADYLIDYEQYQLRKSSESANRSVANQRKISIIVQLIALTLVVAIGVLLSRLIIRPLARLRKDVDLIAKGDLDVKIPIHSTDEIGELTNAVDKLRITVKYLLDDAVVIDQEAKRKK
jgi:methyl-accepting chemotaxis protein